MMTLKTNPTHGWWRKQPQKHVDHLSASSTGQFQVCGLAYRLSHIDKLQLIAPAVPSYFVFGTAVHKGLESHWKGKDATFKEAWLPWKTRKVAYFGSSWLSHYRMGQAMVAGVVAATMGKFDPKSTRVEVTENIDLGFVVLNRRIDVLTEAIEMPILIDSSIEKVDGQLTIDVKTSAQAYDRWTIDRSQQLKTYAIPNPKAHRKQGTHTYLVATKSVHPAIQLIGKRFDREEVKGQVERIRNVREAISRGEFNQHQGDHCGTAERGCDFFRLCYETSGWQSSYRVSGDRPRANAANSRIDRKDDKGKA